MVGEGIHLLNIVCLELKMMEYFANIVLEFHLFCSTNFCLLAVNIDSLNVHLVVEFSKLEIYRTPNIEF